MTLSNGEAMIERRAAAGSKSARTAYLLWLVLGLFGAHRLYLERTGTGVIMLMLAVLGLLTLPIDVGTKFLAVSAAWMIIDAAFIPKMVASQHDEIRQKLIQEAAA
jgi:TM2 domain-containing membrane protein YozV